MELSLLNKCKKKFFLKIVLAILLSFLGLLLWFNVFVESKVRGVNQDARPIARTLLKSYYLSRIGDNYWEDELYCRFEIISNLNKNARMDLYKTLLLYCDDFDTNIELSEIFFDHLMRTKDILPLEKYLTYWKGTNEFNNLSFIQKKRILILLYSFRYTIKKNPHSIGKSIF